MPEPSVQGPPPPPFKRRDDPLGPTFPQRIRLWMRQHPVLITTLISMTVLAVIAVFIVTALHDARNAANSARRGEAQLRVVVRDLEGVIAREKRDRQAAIDANVRARRDDCHNSNRLRKELRAEAVQSQRTLPLLLALLPQLNTPQVVELTKKSNARRLRAYAKRDCEAYAREALP